MVTQAMAMAATTVVFQAACYKMSVWVGSQGQPIFLRSSKCFQVIIILITEVLGTLYIQTHMAILMATRMDQTTVQILLAVLFLIKI